jgi:hypothetical protein
MLCAPGSIPDYSRSDSHFTYLASTLWDIRLARAELIYSIPGARYMDPKFPIKVAILDDYQNVALSMADWSPLENLADVTVFNDHVADIGNLIQRLQPFDVVCVMRERTPLSRVVIEGCRT